ncbi:MAG TPA: GNAT family N-acetyltransferase [Thermoanaerobaculia bacterium]|nr:GNAT family N-acetyltransferase [Thermoanaerobaculia bacterium]
MQTEPTATLPSKGFVEDAQRVLSASAAELRDLRGRLAGLAAGIEEPPEEVLERREAWTWEAEIKSRVECLLADDLDAAINVLDHLAALGPAEPAAPLEIETLEASTFGLDDLYELGLTIPELAVSPRFRFMECEEFLATFGDPASSLVLVATAGGSLLGFLAASLEGETAWIVYLAVLPAARGKGVGRSLSERCFELLAGRRLRRVTCFAAAGSELEGALRRRGFQEGQRFFFMDREI